MTLSITFTIKVNLIKRQILKETIMRIQIVKNNFKDSNLQASLNSLKLLRLAMMIQKIKMMILNLMGQMHTKKSLSYLIKTTILSSKFINKSLTPSKKLNKLKMLPLSTIRSLPTLPPTPNMIKKTMNLKPGQFSNFNSEKASSPICSSLNSTAFPFVSTSGTMLTSRHSSNKISAYLCSLILKICSQNTEKPSTAPTAHSITLLLPNFSTNKTSESPQIRQSLQNLPTISTRLMDL